jgi:hypothetical protein
VYNIGDLVKLNVHGFNPIGIITEKTGVVYTVLWLDEQGGSYDYTGNEIFPLTRKL